MLKKLSIFLFAVALLVGCVPQKPHEDEPQQAGPAVADAQAIRRTQSRIFDTSDEKMVLSAAAETLQELGFIMGENRPEVGLVTCSKSIPFSNAQKEAHNLGTTLGWTLAIFAVSNTITVVPNAPGTVALDKEQKIRASVSSSHMGENGERITVRLIVQRMVTNDKNGTTTAETIADPQLYQTFFDKLAQSLSLEAHGV